MSSILAVLIKDENNFNNIYLKKIHRNVGGVEQRLLTATGKAWRAG